VPLPLALLKAPVRHCSTPLRVSSCFICLISAIQLTVHKTSGAHPEPCAVLSDLKEGTTAVLTDLDVAPQVAENLMNLGFIPGVEVTVSRSGPGGDPRIYRVEGAEVALRSDLARHIGVVPRKPASARTSKTKARKRKAEA
jgi:ferrous iron transport protein A